MIDKDIDRNFNDTQKQQIKETNENYKKNNMIYSEASFIWTHDFELIIFSYPDTQLRNGYV